MKKYILTMVLILEIICATGCMKTTVDSKEDVEVEVGDKIITYNLKCLPYDMEYNGRMFQYSSCELYQEESDDNHCYIPYIVAKVKINGIDDETLHWFDEDLYVYGNISNSKNQLNNKALSKVCKIDNGGYRYYVFSQLLSVTGDYRCDFSESAFNVSFLVPQAVTDRVTGKERTDNKSSKYVYNGYISTNVKDLKDIGKDIWYEIKRSENIN